MGKRTRMSFSRVEESLEMPDLIEVQKNSYQRFLQEDLREVLADVSPITDYSESLVLEFTDYSLDETPKYTVERCRERDLTYAAPLKVNVRLTNRNTHEIKESEVFMGEFPLMTETGTFVINGAERVIVSQIVRSPGMYYASDIDKSGKPIFSAQVIPYRGAWLEYETDVNGVMYVRVDKHPQGADDRAACARWATAPTRRLWNCWATMNSCPAPSRATRPRPPRPVCLRYTSVCVPASR